MPIGILGGSFNPPHSGHRNMARTAIERLELNALYVVPAARPPHKTLSEDTPSDEHRLKMTAINFANMENVIVTDMEFLREGPSYTVDTVREIKSKNPDTCIYLILGTDMFLTFHEWHKYKELLEICTPIVFAREEGQIAEIEKYASSIAKKWNIVMGSGEIIPISSTELRQRLADRDGVEYVGSDLYSYILKEKLYGAKANLGWLRSIAHGLLKPKRVPHVIGVEQEAEKLALRWGADVISAKEAGILHDITKRCDINQQLIMCTKYDIITDIVERENVKLLHAKTGAALSRDMFNISDEVYGAIFWHTTGRANMTLLEQIIYMADYIEPTRDFPGVNKLRELAYNDLYAAMKLGLEMSIEDVKEKGAVPHSRTVEAIDWLNSLGV